MRMFNATAVAAVELAEHRVFTVVLAENSDGGGERLEIQKALSFDEQDRRLGMDTYCLCTAKGTAYGGVTSWALAGDSLEIRLDAKAESALGVDGGFLVGFPPEYRQVLEESLARLFA